MGVWLWITNLIESKQKYLAQSSTNVLHQIDSTNFTFFVFVFFQKSLLSVHNLRLHYLPNLYAHILVFENWINIVIVFCVAYDSNDLNHLQNYYIILK